MAAREAPAEGSADTGEPDSASEDISMEDVLGAGTRRKAAAAKEEAGEDVPQVETQAY